MTISNNKKSLQEQVGRLTNEIEELRLEREESKKNVLHFMQEADSARQELKKAQEIIEEFTTTDHYLQGYSSPPPESIESEDDEDIKEPSKVSILLSKLSLMDQDKISNLFQLVETDNNVIQDLHDAKQSLSQLKSAHVSLKEELDQLQEEYHATRGALQIENERAEVIEKRWKESESSLEHAESTIQSLNRELSNFRQQQECNNKISEATDIKLSQDLCRSKQDLAITVQNYHDCKVKLEETAQTLKHWQTKYDEISTKNTSLQSKQSDELNQAKIRENYLKTINKTLRDEIRKINKVEEELVNIEYLRNVIIKFLERKSTRAQLIPILATLLKCTREDQTRLVKLVRNKAIES